MCNYHLVIYVFKNCLNTNSQKDDGILFKYPILPPTQVYAKLEKYNYIFKFSKVKRIGKHFFKKILQT